MTTFDILVERNNLTITEEGCVKLNPISKFEFITYPLYEEGKILSVSQDVYYGLLLKTYQFNDELDGVEPFDPDQFNEFRKAKIAMFKSLQNTGATK